MANFQTGSKLFLFRQGIRFWNSALCAERKLPQLTCAQLPREPRRACGGSKDTHNISAMDLNSRFFDRIRVKQEPRRNLRSDLPRCNHPGCSEPGEFRAPMGRLREGQYFCFCLDHVREYNASYNYFSGMSPDAVALYQREALVGHRPTWSMGAHGIGAREGRDGQAGAGIDRFEAVRDSVQRPFRAEAPKPRYGIAALKALDQLGLDATADPPTIKARYKDLVKRLHPDANGGDRSNENRLREIIRAYHYLKTVKPA